MKFTANFSKPLNVSANLGGVLINGKDGKDGKSAYEIAVDNGFKGTEEEWLASLKGDKGDKGEDGVGITGATINADGHLVLTLSNGTTIDAGAVSGGGGNVPDEPTDQTALAGAYTPDGTFSNRVYTWDEMVANFENGEEPSYGVDEYDGASLYASGYDVIIPDTVTDAGWLACKNVVLPATTTRVGYTDNIEFEKIYIKATTPPELESGAFDDMLNSATPEQLAKFATVVNIGYGDIYKNATNWSDYADYIEEGAMPI